MKKKLLFVTGTRADFGKLLPLAEVANELGHEVTFFVTGMHMLSKYGLTKTEVHRVCFATVVEFINQRHGDPLDLVLAKTVIGFSDFLRENTPDLVIIHGDRIEATACAMVCSTNYVRCAHVEGGEVSGTIDEALRHCNTKLSHVHFVSSHSAKNRVMRLGENEDRIFVLGSPELDIHAIDSGVRIDEVKRHYDIRFSEYGILIYHPVTSEADEMEEQTTEIIRALEASGKQFVIILPNNDPGSDGIFRALDNASPKQFRKIPSMRFKYFSELLKNAAVVVGNSSVGVREAPFLGVPSLNIGSRQSNRSESPSVKHCLANETGEINSFLAVEWGTKKRRSDHFGDGTAVSLFTKVLKSEELWAVSLQKQFNDVE